MGFVTCRHIGEALINWMEDKQQTNVEKLREITRLLDVGDHRLVSVQRSITSPSVIVFTVDDPSDPLTLPTTLTFDLEPAIIDVLKDYEFDVDFDGVCAAAEVVTSPDGYVLLCQNGEIKRIDPDDLLSDMCFNSVPDMGAVCGVAEQLVLFVDDTGCRRLGRVVSNASSAVASTLADIWTDKPVNTSGYQFPADGPLPNTTYSPSDFITDGGVSKVAYAGGAYGDNMREAPNIVPGKIKTFARIDFNNECTRTYEFKFDYTRAATPTDFVSADSSRFSLGRRVRYVRSDGTWTPWLYQFTPSTGTLPLHATFNGVQLQDSFSAKIGVVAGRSQHEFFYIGATDPANNLQLTANTMRPDAGVPAPRVTMTPIIIA